MEHIQGLHRIAEELGGTVDREQRRVILRIPVGFAAGSAADRTEAMQGLTERAEARARELQQKLKENAGRCGFRCKRCGAVYCKSCLSAGGGMPRAGPANACLACGGSLRTL